MGRLRDTLKRCPGLRSGVWMARTLRDRTVKRLRMLCGDRHTRRLAALRDAHAGRRGWVIGNGPSLNLLDLSALAGEVTFASNCFFLMYDRIDWRPSYLLVEDHLVAEDNADTLNALSDSHKLFARDLRYCLRANATTTYMDVVRGEYPGFPRFSRRCDLRVYTGGTVTYLALQLAAWMGCDPIVLIGVDMSYQLPDHADGDEITSRDADPNHFHPDYFGPGRRWHDPRVDRMLQSMDAAATACAEDGITALNATAGGRCEAFRRAAYADVLAGRYDRSPAAREVRDVAAS